MNFAQTIRQSPIPMITAPSVLHDLTNELISLLDELVDELARTKADNDGIRQLAIARAELECELLPGIEIDRTTLKAECLDVALLLGSAKFMVAGDVWTRTVLLATSLAGAA